MVGACVHLISALNKSGHLQRGMGQASRVGQEMAGARFSLSRSEVGTLVCKGIYARFLPNEPATYASLKLYLLRSLPCVELTA